MKIRKKAESIQRNNTDTCVAYEYKLPTSAIDSAVIELSGRYPESGWVLNTVSESILHVVGGAGIIYFEEGSTLLEEDDQVLIQRGERYALEGGMKLLFSATPAWTSEQANFVE